MTTREHLNRNYRRSSVIIVAGILLFIAGIVAKSGHGSLAALDIFGFVVVGCGIILTTFGGRCLHCRRLLGRMFFEQGIYGKVSQNLRFCPYCGTSLDAPSEDSDNA